MKIVEPIIIGGMQKNQSVKTDGVCTTLTSSMGTGGGYTPMIVASRGRNPQNPSDRTPGNHVEQRLEPNSDGICNTLTSVQKDNLVLEPAIIQKVGDRGTSNYSMHDYSNTIPANPMSDRGQLLIEPTIRIKQATKDGCIECKLGGVADLSYPTSKTRRGRVQDNGDTCPTLTATETGVCRIERAPITTTGGQTDIGCTQMANYYRSNMSGFVTENAVYETPYRIRKLTPLECAKLMNFTEEDANKMMSVNSNTQVYKQCGNSICTNVLQAIFCQMNIKGCPTWGEYAKEHYL